VKAVTITLAIQLLAAPSLARCKLETHETGHVETRALTIYRGGSVGLQGHFGVKDGRSYLRALYFSQFRAAAEFPADSPLELTLADGTHVELRVLEPARAELQWAYGLINNREAQPLYEISAPQWHALATSPIAHARIAVRARGEPLSYDWEIRRGHAEKIVEAIQCLVDAAAPRSG